MEEMLKAVGAGSLDELIEQTVPASIRQKGGLDWAPLAEHELLAKMREVAGRNRVMTRPRSSGTSWKTRRGTRPIRPISPRSHKAGLRRF